MNVRTLPFAEICFSLILSSTANNRFLFPFFAHLTPLLATRHDGRRVSSVSRACCCFDWVANAIKSAKQLSVSP
jgi:hypothetical protein